MRTTTKILLGGLFTIGSIFWISYYVIAPSSELVYPPYQAVVPKGHFATRYPEGIDLVYNYLPHSRSYQTSRNEHSEQNPTEETLRFRNRGSDYTPFILRGFHQSVKWARRLIFIVPDGQKISRTVNTNAPNSPPIVIVYHSDFIPSAYLPTFSANVVNFYLHKIKDLSEDFVFVNDHTILWNLDLSYFYENNSYAIHTLEAPVRDRAVFYPNSVKKTYDLVFSGLTPPDFPPTLLDTLGPILLSKSHMGEMVSQYAKHVNETSAQIFISEGDVLPLELYLFSYKSKLDFAAVATLDSFKKMFPKFDASKDGNLDKEELTQLSLEVTQQRQSNIFSEFAGQSVESLKTSHAFYETFTRTTRGYHITPSRVLTTTGYNPAEEVRSLRDTELGSKYCAIYFPYTVWKTNWVESKEGLERFLFATFPKPSPLEFLIHNYSTHGLVIGLFFSVGILSILYSFLHSIRALHIK